MKKLLKKVSKKSILIASILIVLIGVPVLAYLFTREQTEDTSAWYNSNWMYRRAISVSNTGGNLTNEDVFITIDTASLISAGKLLSNCNDLRFVDNDDSTLLQYWVEDDCNTANTKIWVRIPSLPSGGKTIYTYYGNNSAPQGSLTWSGNITILADASCPTGWTRNTSLDGRFPYGSVSYGGTGGSSSHDHGNLSVTSTALNGTSQAGATTGSLSGASSSHTHTALSVDVVTQTNVLPPYIDMIYCYRNKFTLPTSGITLFEATVPSGWTRFSALDSRYPRGASSYGATGGSSTHTHSTSGRYNTGANTNAVTTDGYSPGTGSQGALNVTSGTTTLNTDTYPSGYNYTTISVSSGAVLTATGSNPLILRATGNVTISGTVRANGANGSAGDGGTASRPGGVGTVGGSSGGAGGGYNGNGYIGIGTGRGGPGLAGTNNDGGGGGGGAGYGVAGTTGQTHPGTDGTGGAGGSTYGNVTITSLLGGSGGGGGAGTRFVHTRATGGGGGAGGGAIQIISNGNVTVNSGAVFSTNGGAGGAGYSDGGAGGGGGSGGSIRVSSTGTITINGTVSSSGGAAGLRAASTAASGGAGGAGRIRLEAISISGSTTPAASTSTATIHSANGHTHESANGTSGSGDHTPPYMDMIFGKNNAEKYVTYQNILISSELPPLGWNRYSDLDSRFVRGNSTAKSTGGSATHSHSVTITTGGPSTKIMGLGSGTNFASGTHTHSATTTTGTFSNNPPYLAVIYIQRKESVDTLVGSEEIDNMAPTAPTALLTEGQTNPSRVTDLTPEFSAIFNDPDTADTGVFYQIQVNTSSAFDGTTMWDSTKTAISPITNGQRSPEISYNGTPLSLNGETYYWRIKFWDQNLLNNESPWSATAAFTMNRAPTEPTDLLTESSINPIKVYDTTPEFSAVFNDPDTGDTGIHYQIQVSTVSNFTSTVWDSNQTSISAISNGARSPDISYGGTPLALDGTLYYWRIKFWDQAGTESSWSSTATFRMSANPYAPIELKVDGRTNPPLIDSARPTFYATHRDANEDNAIFVEINVNSNASFTGTIKWNTGKVSIDPVVHGAEYTVTYGGTQLLGDSTTYYWRIRFWDVDDNVSPWSATASFVDLFKYTRMNGIGLDGLRIN